MGQPAGKAASFVKTRHGTDAQRLLAVGQVPLGAVFVMQEKAILLII